MPGSSYTYFYKLNDPGTFLYHCHVEASEHMQMGMLGNLYVHPKQDGQSFGGYNKFVYNDGDGSTGYDVEYPIQLASMDGAFHDASRDVQPLPFANMLDTYSMLNGRGYPDTADPRGGNFPPPAERADQGTSSQPLSSLITATQGQTVLLRISNLSTTSYYTLSAMGLPMKVVGTGAHILRGPDGQVNLYYDTNSVTLGGGETADVLIDTTGVPQGTYYLYTTNLNYLSNDNEDFGGMMTEIVIN
jgi:FtsP/CotA-like multicopper oxidase with cupredoxin domain